MPRTHAWNLSPKQAIKIQQHLRHRIRLRPYSRTPQLIAAADVAFKRNLAKAAVVVLKYPDFKIVEQVIKTAKISYPYIPGLLTFREGPILEKCFQALKSEPDLIIFDAQGIAHPRRMGSATHMGIILDKPTIGCAKTHLFGEYKEPGKKRGAFSYIFNPKKKKIGAVLRTKDNVRPVYVSPGYKMDIASAIRIILLCTKRYRLPEPLCIAHQLTQK